jgi:TonB-linked SusC/RagA family outer membrane protein
MDKYLINGTVRRDGSSRFGGNNKFGIFPSVGVAWKVNKESFFYGNEWLKKNVSMFKIRGGWGKIGNENIANYLFLSQYGKSILSGYSFGGTRVEGSVPLAPVNPDIKWEESTSWNVGTDINMFNNKIMFNYDFFIKHNYDNLIKIAVPTVAGVDEVSGAWPTVNAGTIRNYGSEFSLTYQNQYQKENAKHAFTYSINANFTIINNEVTGMDGGVLYGGRVQPQNLLLTETREGYPIAAFFGYKVDGVFNSWAEVNQGVQKDAKPGDFKIVDIDGDGEITPNDMTYIGNPHPKFSYGLNLDAGYAGFDLSLAFQGVQGNDIFNATKWYLDGGYEQSNMSTRRLDAWSETNKSSEPTDPSWFTSKNVNGNGIFPNSAFIENGSYVRLKNVTLGYTLPERISNKFFMQKLRVYVQAQNVFTITKYSGMDPEIGSNEETNWEGPEFGIDRGVYPQARTFVYGVNITF